MLIRALALSVLFVSPPLLAAEPDIRVLAEGQPSQDSRLGPLTTLNGHFPFAVPESLPAWEARADQLRQRIQVASGLWPNPERTPLNAQVFGRVQRDGFTVEKVILESVPGHYVTGLLFRPEGQQAGQKYPAVLCPHGHGGRLEDRGVDGVRRAIVNGEERFEESGRFPALARCAQLARMGCVNFIFDMIGYGDSVQIPFEVAHRAAQVRPDMEGTDEWGFYSTTAELRSQSIMGLQMWNNVRSLDFLASLPDVDPTRMAVTGNSGGGTQTLLLCAIDPRPIAAFPNGMVSTSMQGGCYCENTNLLRVGTGNVELTALFAPRPVAMTAVDDWTRDMMTDGYPELQKLYAMYGKKDAVLCQPYPRFPHNYNYVTRCLMYRFFNQHMGLGLSEPIVEEDYRLLTPEEYTVWDQAHPRPANGPDYERALVKQMADASDAQLKSIREQDASQFRETVLGAYQTVVGRSLPPEGAITWESRGSSHVGDAVVEKGLLIYGDRGEQIPTLIIRGDTKQAPKSTTVLLQGFDKANVLEADGSLSPEVRERVGAGGVVLAMDLFGAGENAEPDVSEDSQRMVDDDRPYAAFTFGYNPTRLAHRVHDVMTAVRYLRDTFDGVPVELVARNGAAATAAVARAVVGEAIDSATIDTEGFRFAALKSFRDAQFVPGAVKYGDMPVLLGLSAPLALTVQGEAAPLEDTTRMYETQNASGAVTFAD